MTIIWHTYECFSNIYVSFANRDLGAVGVLMSPYIRSISDSLNKTVVL